MVKRILISAIIVLFATVVANAQNWVNVETVDGLKIIKPKFTSVDMAFGNESPKYDKSIILCVGAAFTGEELDDFSHENIAGPHAGGGKVYEGYLCKRNTGAFVYNDGQWKFLYGKVKKANYKSFLNKAARNKGCGFEQEMMVYNKKQVKTTRSKGNINVFRALCDKDGELLVIESTSLIQFGEFIKQLLDFGVENAIYLDMGTWRYGWYRPNANSFVELHQQMHNNHTNWLIFKK